MNLNSLLIFTLVGLARKMRICPQLTCSQTRNHPLTRTYRPLIRMPKKQSDCSPLLRLGFELSVPTSQSTAFLSPPSAHTELCLFSVSVQPPTPQDLEASGGLVGYLSSLPCVQPLLFFSLATDLGVEDGGQVHGRVREVCSKFS